MERVVIVGAGQAGGRAAQGAREAGFRGEIVLIGAEPHVPYQRPPLSKEYLRGESRRQDFYTEPADFYDEHGIQLLSGRRAERLDVRAREVHLSDDAVIPYDRLLLATGARPVSLPSGPERLDGLLQLRTIEDSDALRERLHPGTRLLIAGGGWIGCEVAASATELGASVSMVIPEPFPLYRVLGAEIGGFFKKRHEDHGVSVIAGEPLASIEGTEMVTAGVTRSGQRIACDVLLLGIGVQPRVELARDAGIRCDDGIVTGAGFLTSHPTVFAAGDVARVWHPLYGRAIRVEHWFNADRQGFAAGRALAGEPVEYREVPYFFSDQYDIAMEYSGMSSPDDRIVLRGDGSSGEMTAVWIRSGRVVTAVLTINSDAHHEVRQLVGTHLTPEEAADESRELVGAHT